MELRRTEDRSGKSFYILTDREGENFVSDIDGLAKNLEEFFRVKGEIAETIMNMAIEGYTVRYYAEEKKVTAEIFFLDKESPGEKMIDLDSIPENMRPGLMPNEGLSEDQKLEQDQDLSEYKA